MRDCGGELLGVYGNGFVRTDKVLDLTGDDPFGYATLHFGNAVRLASGARMLNAHHVNG
jgi:hypothetical protein